AFVHGHVDAIGEELFGARRERRCDLDRVDAALGSDDLGSERSAVAASAPELDETIACAELEQPEREQIRMRRADRREALVVQRERDVFEAALLVSASHEARAIDLRERVEVCAIERAELAID